MIERGLRIYVAVCASRRVLMLLAAIVSVSWVSAADDLIDPQTLVASAASQLVASLQRHIESVKHDDDLAHELANEAVVVHLDFRKIARLVLGKYWREAHPDQRRRFQEEFRKYLTKIYVSAMVSYADEIVSHADGISYLPVRYRQNGSAATVRSRLSLRTGEDIAVDYRLHHGEDGWKIYDVVIEGVSLVTTYRSSIAAEITRGGLDQVIDDLARKTQ